MEFRPPDRFDDFVVVRPLGRGGMGHVFLGHDVTLDRSVALKFISGDPDAEARRRFLTEARALARLHHPNVVSVFRVGDAGDQPYIAYEFVPGRTADQLGAPLPWGSALRIAVGLARGLEAAHRAGILHRDLKPGNVVVSESGAVKLLDFGIASLTADTRTPIHGVPRLGAPARVTQGLIGTPAYLAPEQWLGEPASQRSDIYAFGLVMFELLTGRPAHPRVAATELGAAIIAWTNPPVQSVKPDVPEAVARIVDRCLRREAAERWPGAVQLREALEAVQSLFLPLSASTAPATLEGDARVVAESFARVAPRLDELTSMLYADMFSRDPQLRLLFPASLDGQRAKLAHALRLVVEGLHEPERLVPLLEDLGKRHAGYRAPAHGYELLGRALLTALARLDAGHWSDDVADAWRRAYAFIANTMQRAQGLQSTTYVSGRIETPAPFEPPRTRWTPRSSIAWQEFGAGPVDLLVVPPWISHVELIWRHPLPAAFLRRLSKLGRVVLFDKRGTGLSDRMFGAASVEEGVRDAREVMEAAGVRNAVVLGISEGAAIAAALQGHKAVLYGALPRRALAAEQIRERWGEPLFVEDEAPSLAGDPAFRAWHAEYLRMSASPMQAITMLAAPAQVTSGAALILRRAGDRLATPLPGETVLPGEDHLPFAGDQDAIFAELARLLAQPRFA